MVVEQVDHISQNKGRIAELELDNHEIAEQNEGLREGALEGVHALEQMEKAQKQVQELHEQLAEQAETIKHLLTQNKRLNDQIEEYEERERPTNY